MREAKRQMVEFPRYPEPITSATKPICCPHSYTPKQELEQAMFTYNCIRIDVQPLVLDPKQVWAVDTLYKSGYMLVKEIPDAFVASARNVRPPPISSEIIHWYMKIYECEYTYDEFQSGMHNTLQNFINEMDTPDHIMIGKGMHIDARSALFEDWGSWGDTWVRCRVYDCLQDTLGERQTLV
jgi:hypothetical protein